MNPRTIRRLLDGTRWAVAVFFVISIVMVGASAFAAEKRNSDGIVGVFMGHSFFRPFADALPAHAQRAGIAGHSQTSVFAGGENGAPQALWENPQNSAEVKAALDAGNVELFGMTFHGNYPTTEGYENWIDYALQSNPDIEILIALPWSDFPADVDAETYASFWLNAHATVWQDFINSIRDLYPGLTIRSMPYGRSAIDLRNLFEAGNLPDVTAMTGDIDTAIFTDAKGHAGQILRDTGSLVWLRTIYGVDLDTYAWNDGYETDIRAIATEIVDWAESNWGVGPELTAIRSTKFKLRDDATAPVDPGKRRFAFRSSSYKGSPSGVVVPAFGESGDPTISGATLTIYPNGAGQDEVVEFTLPAERWERAGSDARPGYRYADARQDDSPIHRALLRTDRLVLVGKGAGLPALENAPQGEMVLRMQLGTGVEFCAVSEALSPASRHDTTARFNGDKASPPPAVCPPLPGTPYGSASQAFIAAPASLLE